MIIFNSIEEQPIRFVTRRRTTTSRAPARSNADRFECIIEVNSLVLTLRGDYRDAILRRGRRRKQKGGLLTAFPPTLLACRCAVSILHSTERGEGGRFQFNTHSSYHTIHPVSHPPRLYDMALVSTGTGYKIINGFTFCLLINFLNGPL